VVCGAIELDPDDRRGHSVSNPIVLVEVLSPSTEDYDRGEKLAHYKRVPSLREIALVAHDEPRIDVWRRLDDRWTLLSFRTGEAVVLDSLTIELSVADVYFDPLAAPVS
jgi:Uma2 family endonuclease